MAGSKDTERPDIFPGHMPAGRIVRPLAGRLRRIPDPEGGDGVEGKTLPEISTRIEAAVLDAGAGLQRVEEALDPPAQLVSAHRHAGGLEIGLAPGGRQHPVGRRLPPSRRCPAGPGPINNTHLTPG